MTAYHAMPTTSRARRTYSDAHRAAAILELRRRERERQAGLNSDKVSYRRPLFFYGAAAEFMDYQGSEAVLSGPYETGKTIAALQKLHLALLKYPNARALMVRKTYQSLVTSVVPSYEKKVLPHPPGHPDCPVTVYGGEKPEWYTYPNGARLMLGGLDKPDKFLSGEFDIVYFPQAEEGLLGDWETLSGRVTGRAGNIPNPQMLGDCNPGAPNHWLLGRSAIKLLHSRHEDNPTLFDQETKQWTAQGLKTLAKLDQLTGVRYKRGRLGLWAGTEGQVYEEFDAGVHVIDSFIIPREWRRVRAIDFGFTNPFVCLWGALDPDGRLYITRQLYQTGMLVEDLAREIVRLSAGEIYTDTYADHDAEDRATLQRHGVSTVPAKKDISLGLQAVQARLRKAGDGKARLFVFRDSLVREDFSLAEKFKSKRLEDEFLAYVWPQGIDGKPNKETPVDDNNHAMDALRYMVMGIERRAIVANVGRYA